MCILEVVHSIWRIEKEYERQGVGKRVRSKASLV